MGLTSAKPIRTCLVCRKKGSRQELTRIALVKEESSFYAVKDYTKSLPGRGAWVHDNDGCFTTLQRKNVLNRAFKFVGQINLDQLESKSG
ncbi:MAG: YlxR family protein [Micrococcaceae bacterium]